MRRNFLKKGESLIEVIIAISIVAMGSAVATSLIVNALQSNQFSRDNLIALNLAVEGIEAVRSVRDANWVKFSYDKEKCWNMRPEVGDCLAAPKPIAEGKYTVDLDLKANNYGWVLPNLPIGTALDLDLPLNNSAPYHLFYYDIDGAKNSDGKGNNTDDHDLLATNVNTPWVIKSGESKFYRMVQIHYQPNGAPADPAFDVVSTVEWKAQGVTHKVELSTRLTNYQKVKTP